MRHSEKAHYAGKGTARSVQLCRLIRTNLLMAGNGLLIGLRTIGKERHCCGGHLCTIDPARMNRCIHPASCRPTSPLDSWSIERIRAKVSCERFGSLIKSGTFRVETCP